MPLVENLFSRYYSCGTYSTVRVSPGTGTYVFHRPECSSREEKRPGTEVFTMSSPENESSRIDRHFQ